jgi:hypothetical protein
VAHGNGSYTYTFATDITRVTSPMAVSYNASLTHRVSFEICGFVPADNPAYDFRPDDGATKGLFSRDIVKTANCNRCHEKPALHSGNRNDNPQVCVTCHNPNATDISRRPANPADTVDGKAEEGIDFNYMIHRIHAADIVVYGFGNSVNDFTDALYPQRPSHCTACHTANGYYPVAFDSGVLATSTGADPTSPRDDINITPNASACSGCHTASNSKLHMGAERGNFRCLPGCGRRTQRASGHLRRHAVAGHLGDLHRLSWPWQDRRRAGRSRRKLMP